MYSVSYQANEQDNGHCVTFWTLEAAEAFRNEALETCWDVGPIRETCCPSLTLCFTHNAKGIEL